jgi:hypothetical protein
MPIFLWESIGQFQQRPGSGTGFGTFGGGGGRKRDTGIRAGGEKKKSQFCHVSYRSENFRIFSSSENILIFAALPFPVISMNFFFV